MIECKIWIFLGTISFLEDWMYIGGSSLAWWKSRLRVLREERVRDKYARIFEHTVDITGDDRAIGFKYCMWLHSEMNKELQAIKKATS